MTKKVIKISFCPLKYKRSYECLLFIQVQSAVESSDEDDELLRDLIMPIGKSLDKDKHLLNSKSKNSKVHDSEEEDEFLRQMNLPTPKSAQMVKSESCEEDELLRNLVFPQANPLKQDIPAEEHDFTVTTHIKKSDSYQIPRKPYSSEHENKMEWNSNSAADMNKESESSIHEEKYQNKSRIYFNYTLQRRLLFYFLNIVVPKSFSCMSIGGCETNVKQDINRMRSVSSLKPLNAIQITTIIKNTSKQQNETSLQIIPDAMAKENYNTQLSQLDIVMENYKNIMETLRKAQPMDTNESDASTATNTITHPDQMSLHLREMTLFIESIEQTLDPITQHITTYRQLSDENYRKMIASLNRRQHRLLITVLSTIKQNTTPFYFFVSGGASTGKTHVIKAIFQTVNKYLDCIEPKSHNYALNPSTFDKQPVKLNILLTALENSLATTISGSTIHQAFCIPTTIDRTALLQLDKDAIEKLRHHYRNLRLIIIDDIHLISLDLFYHIDTRLRQILNKDLVFGGVSVIVLGDINRTHPSISATVYANNQSANTYPCLATNSLWENFQLSEFKERLAIYPSLTMLETPQNPAVEIEMNRLRKTRLIPERFNLLKDEHDNQISLHANLRIIYHNIDANLSTCLPFIKSDYGFMNAGIIILSKCHTNPKNNYNLLLNGYTMLKLTGSENFNSTNGTALYVHNKYIEGDKPSIIFHNDNSINGMYTSNDLLEIGAIKFMSRGTNVHLCYFTVYSNDIDKSWKEFKTFIDQNIPSDERKQENIRRPLRPLILVGTIKFPRNLDYNPIIQILNKLPQRYGLINYVNTSTHDLNYTTDFCFTNCVQLLNHQVDVYESFYSHHKPIVIKIDKQ